MLTSWVSMILILLLSALTGRALTRFAGGQRWNGLEPALGFAALLTVGGLLARLPGGRWLLIIGLVLLVAGSAWVLRRPGREDLPEFSRGLLAALGLAFLAVNIPFVVTGHWGLLGVGFNNDLGLHLAWTDWLRSGVGTEPATGYPLGPHALVAVLAFIPKLNPATVFTGQLMAIVLLTAWTAWVAVERLAGWKRTLAALLVAGGYLLASWFAQAAFKELAAALFLLAFAIWLGRILAERQAVDRRALLVPVVLSAGIIFSYSFPGLAWPIAVLAAAAVTHPGIRSGLKPSRIARMIRRPVIGGSLLGAVALILILAFLGPFGFGGAFAEVAASDAFGPVSPIEGLGVWLNPDYRLQGTLTDTTLPVLGGVIAVLALLISLWWWSRQRWSIWPAAFLGCLFVYLVSLPWMGEYSLAKALTVAAPVTMTVILVALLSGPPGTPAGRRTAIRTGWAAVAVLFTAGAVASSLLVLRDAAVAPPGQALELAEFSNRINGQRVLYMDQDRFAAWYLSGSHVGIPLGDFPDPDVIENPKKPFQGENGGQSAIDFDSFDPQTFRNFDFAITTSAGWQSAPFSFFREVDRTANYILWRRVGPPAKRPILREAPMPARLVDCESEGGRYFRQLDGEAVLMPETKVIYPQDWSPEAALRAGKSSIATVELPRGEWRMSIQYFSPAGLRLQAPGYDRHLRPALNGQRLANMDFGSNGQYWPAGVYRTDRRRSVTFTVSTRPPSAIQRLTGYARRTQIGQLVLMRNEVRDRVPMNRICDRWVDFFRRSESLRP